MVQENMAKKPPSKIKALIELSGHTIQDVADASGRTKGLVWFYIHGKTDNALVEQIICNYTRKTQEEIRELRG